MKLIQLVSSAALLALIVGGCKTPTEPVFSPDGGSVAFESGGKLVIQSGRERKLASETVQGPVSWSPDGTQIAFTSNQGARILDLRTGRVAKNDGLAFPFWWRGDDLVAVRREKGSIKSALVTVDGRSAQPVVEVELPFSPDSIFPLSGDEALLQEGSNIHLFNGLTSTKVPQLRSMFVVGRGVGDRPIFGQTRLSPNGLYTVIDLYEWTGDLRSNPSRLTTVDLAAVVRHPIFLIRSYMERGGTAVALVDAIECRSPADRARLGELIRRYRLLGPEEAQQQPPKRVMDEASDIVQRSHHHQVCLAKLAGSWHVLRRDVGLAKATAKLSRVALSDDGSTVAMVVDGKLVTRALTD